MSPRSPRFATAALAAGVVTQASGAAPAGAQDVPDCAPDLASTIDHATIVAGLSAEDEERWDARSRRSAWIPAGLRVDLSDRFGWTEREETRLAQDFDSSLQPEGVDVDDLERADRDRLTGWQITAQWELDEALWSTDALSIERVRRQRAESRAALAELVVDLYFQWISALTTPPTNSPPAPRSRAHPAPVAEALAAHHLAAQLDALTDGWFGVASTCAGEAGAPAQGETPNP